MYEQLRRILRNESKEPLSNSEWGQRALEDELAKMDAERDPLGMEI